MMYSDKTDPYNRVDVLTRTQVKEEFHSCSDSVVTPVSGYQSFRTDTKSNLDMKSRRIIKRSFDITFSLFLFILVFSWLWPLIMFAIRISSAGPVFYKQLREGKAGEKFVCYKFRTMNADSSDVDEKGNYNQTEENDSRVTLVGRLLRHFSLDELPQFYNVLKGEMSIVGPRPHPLPLNEEYKERIPSYSERHRFRPGITGLAQINGFRGPTDLKSMRDRVACDLCYFRQWSFGLDLKIITISIWKMIKGDTHAF